MAPDQAPHLDALIGGIIILLNMMFGKAYIGVYLNSGGFINALKQLVKSDYEDFKSQFAQAKTADGRPLSEAMKGGSFENNLDMAWDWYAETKLKGSDFYEPFQRVYIELEEFEMFLGSMSVYHFGARYPCFVPLSKMPIDAWHLRLHMYIGNKQVLLANAVENSKEFSKECEGKVVGDEPVAKNTIDLLSLPANHRGLRPAHRLILE